MGRRCHVSAEEQIISLGRQVQLWCYKDVILHVTAPLGHPGVLPNVRTVQG